MRMKYGFLRVAAVVPAVNVADCEGNAQQIISEMRRVASQDGAKVIVTPELGVTGYTCGDLFLQTRLLEAAQASIDAIRRASVEIDSVVFVGAPLRFAGSVYNCAVAISRGKILGVVPKTYLPNYKEFYEKRWFASGEEIADEQIDICGHKVPFSTQMLLVEDELKIAVELCEDLWVAIPPSSYASLAGANVVVNMSASNEVIGKHRYLLDLIRQQSARCRVAYVYASAGYGESTTDVVFAGNAIVAENGTVLAQGERFGTSGTRVVCDVDIEQLENERQATSSFADCRRLNPASYMAVGMGLAALDSPDGRIMRDIKPHPFVPSDGKILNDRCEEIINIQVAGLMRRISFIGCRSLVVGVSGGLDSTLALLVAVRAFDRLGLDRKGIFGITMPGFGTTGRTYSNAIQLMRSLGVSVVEIPIGAAVTQHFGDIGQDPAVHDVTYENSQARERTQILMDYANKCGGIVLGTGDLSELALGWATYNGDHMSMYGVNVSIPKTLVRYLVRWFASTGLVANGEASGTLLDIVDTPISPELIPADEQGNIRQKTEDLVGPYELHDFFLYYMLRHGFSPSKIFRLAQQAFAGQYGDGTIKRWLREFCRRFFQQQFKRSCLPDGPKVGSVSLSPRGDWRMPSDASAAMWIKECDQL